MKSSSLLNLFVTLSFIVALSAFQSCTETDPDVESQDEHVCEHLMDGPSIAMTAAPDLVSALDSLQNATSYRVQHVMHTRYDVSLPRLNDSLYRGFVPYLPVAEDGDYVLYADADLELVILDHTNGDTVIPAEIAWDHSDDCLVVRYKAIYELLASHTYLIQISDSTRDHVGIVFPALLDNADEHDH